MTPGLASICWSGPLDGPNLCRECGVAEDWSGGGVAELCSNGHCPECCEAFACHLECVVCKTKVDAEDVCECCNRCSKHECASEEAEEREIELELEVERADLVAACVLFRVERDREAETCQHGEDGDCDECAADRAVAAKEATKRQRERNEYFAECRADAIRDGWNERDRASGGAL